MSFKTKLPHSCELSFPLSISKPGSQKKGSRRSQRPAKELFKNAGVGRIDSSARHLVRSEFRSTTGLTRSVDFAGGAFAS